MKNSFSVWVIAAMLSMPCISPVTAESLVDFREAIRSVEPALATVSVETAVSTANPIAEPLPDEPANPTDKADAKPADDDLPRGRRFEFFGVYDQPLRPLRGNGRRFLGDLQPDPVTSAAFAISDSMFIAFVGDAAESATIEFANGDAIKGKIIAVDRVTGLAAIEVEQMPLASLTVSVANTEPGMPVVAAWIDHHHLRTDAGMIASHPLATDSGVGLTPRIDFGSTDQMIGAPVIDAEGFVVGALVPAKTGGLVCTPSSGILRLIQSATNDKPQDLKRGLIGIQFQSGGPLVQQISPGSAAEKAGILAGDLVRQIDEIEVRDAQDVVSAVANERAGDTVEITILRGEQTHTYSLTLTEHPDQRIAQGLADASGITRMQQAFELRDGKLVPMEIMPDGKPFPGGSGRIPIEEFFNEMPRAGTPNWLIPPQRGGIDGFQIERSEVEKTLRELQRQMEQLNKKLDQQP